MFYSQNFDGTAHARGQMQQLRRQPCDAWRLAADDDAVLHSSSDSLWVMMLHALARVKMLVVNIVLTDVRVQKCTLPQRVFSNFLRNYARTTHDCSDM